MGPTYNYKPVQVQTAVLVPSTPPIPLPPRRQLCFHYSLTITLTWFLKGDRPCHRTHALTIATAPCFKRGHTPPNPPNSGLSSSAEKTLVDRSRVRATCEASTLRKDERTQIIWDRGCCTVSFQKTRCEGTRDRTQHDAHPPRCQKRRFSS